MTSPAAPSTTAPTHPRGLYVLFFTEMWERFSYYGMRALLVLFMVDAVKHQGMGLTDTTAAAIYGLYTAGVYLAALPGGWIADRFLGAQRSVWYGGIIITAGHVTLALTHGSGFYLGLVLVVLGTGLLKPNVSAIVGELYPEGGARRDAGFTLFYMGINLGAALGPLVASALGEKFDWHWGFGAAGVGMFLGLIQYRLSARHLGTAGLLPGRAGGASRRDYAMLFGLVGSIVVAVSLVFTGLLPINPVALANGTAYLIVGIAVVYFVGLFLFGGLDAVEKKRIAVIGVLFLSSAVFWSGFEQAGSSLNLFADRNTQRAFGGFLIPAGWFQALNPIFIISLAPLVAAGWVFLARRNANPSLPVKFAWGLLLLGGGFLVMMVAATLAGTGGRVMPTWLITTYVLHSVGELCLSPVGLSSVTKLAPRRLVGQMMGIWFLATSLGNLMAGLMAGGDGASTPLPVRYLHIVLMAAAAGGLLLILARPINSLSQGVK